MRTYSKFKDVPILSEDDLLDVDVRIVDAKSGAPVNPELENARPSTVGEEELQLQLALAMSKEEHDEDKRKQRDDDVRLQLAIEESRKNGIEPTPETLLELMARHGGGGAQASAAPFPATLASPPMASDPWAPSPKVPPPAAASDPWGASTPQQPAADPWGAPEPPPPANDPWAPKAGGLTATTSPPNAASPWESPAQHPTTNGVSNGNNLDDAFDMLRTRSSSAGNVRNPESFDLLAGGSSSNDPYDMSSMNDAVPGAPNIPPRKKSAADFLGDNANLVNLDMLVTKPKSQSPTNLNPFGSVFDNRPEQTGIAGASNPFGAPPPRVPMNQMPTSSSMGFTDIQQAPPQGPVMPMPLMGAPTMGMDPNMGAYPVGMQPMPPHQPVHQQTNNPFL